MAEKENNCAHERTRKPSRPIPDWTGVCPDCWERVKHDGRGGFITVREVNEWLARRKHLTLDPEDVAVMRESLWHSLQRADVSDEDHRRMRQLREELGDAA